MIIELKAMEFMNGRMEENMKEIEKKIKCMEKDIFHDQMVELIKEDMHMIRRMATENSIGRMEKCIKDYGGKASKMEKEKLKKIKCYDKDYENLIKKLNNCILSLISLRKLENITIIN